jgi:hypothetical protein
MILQKMQNKPNIKIAKVGISSLLTSEYEDFVPFVAKKNKANCFVLRIACSVLRIC